MRLHFTSEAAAELGFINYIHDPAAEYDTHDNEQIYRVSVVDMGIVSHLVRLSFHMGKMHVPLLSQPSLPTSLRHHQPLELL